MSDFEEWFRSLNANGKTVYFLGNEHKVSEMAWNHQQAKIEQLKAKNEKTQKQFNFLLDKNIRDESAHATLKLKFMEVSRLVRSLRSEFDLWSDSPPVERQIELLEEIMRGGHE